MTEKNENPWVDDVMLGVANSHRLLDFMIRERNQLYGTIIYLMELLEKNRVIMPTIESLKEYHSTFYVLFDQEGQDFFVNIKPRDELGVESNGEEDS